MLLHDLYHKKKLNTQKWVLDNLLFVCKGGSELYDIKTETSDHDIWGITMPLKSQIFPHLFGNIYGFDQINTFNQYQEHHILDETSNIYDVTIYGLIQFFSLAKDNNSKMLGLLYIPQKHILFNTPIFQRIIEHRDLFLSKLAYHKFKGYAYSNWYKLKSKQPEGKRKVNIEKFGYDTKYASHTFRLIYEAEDILKLNTINLGTNFKFLRKIREGNYNLDKLTEELNFLDGNLHKSYLESELPEKPNHDKIKELLWSCIEMHYQGIRIKNSIDNNLLNELRSLVEKYQ